MIRVRHSFGDRSAWKFLWRVRFTRRPGSAAAGVPATTRRGSDPSRRAAPRGGGACRSIDHTASAGGDDGEVEGLDVVQLRAEGEGSARALAAIARTGLPAQRRKPDDGKVVLWTAMPDRGDGTDGTD